MQVYKKKYIRNSHIPGQQLYVEHRTSSGYTSNTLHLYYVQMPVRALNTFILSYVQATVGAYSNISKMSIRWCGRKDP